MQIILGQAKHHKGVFGVICIVFLLLLLSQHDKGVNLSQFSSHKFINAQNSRFHLLQTEPSGFGKDFLLYFQCKDC